jgi:hypothetical protein
VSKKKGPPLGGSPTEPSGVFFRRLNLRYRLGAQLIQLRPQRSAFFWHLNPYRTVSDSSQDRSGSSGFAVGDPSIRSACTRVGRVWRAAPGPPQRNADPVLAGSSRDSLSTASARDGHRPHAGFARANRAAPSREDFNGPTLSSLASNTLVRNSSFFGRQAWAEISARKPMTHRPFYIEIHISGDELQPFWAHVRFIEGRLNKPPSPKWQLITPRQVSTARLVNRSSRQPSGGTGS